MAYQGHAIKVTFSDGITADVQKVHGIKVDAAIADFRHLSFLGPYAPRKVPSRVEWEEITLQRGLTQDNSFSQWADGVLQNGLSAKWRKSVDIKILDPQSGNTVAQFSFAAAWPARWSAGQLDPGQPDSLIEELVIAHNGFKRIK